jgi:hypothetical protein
VEALTDVKKYISKIKFTKNSPSKDVNKIHKIAGPDAGTA